MKNKIKIAVLCGGLSNEREVSLKSGRQVFENLDSDKYDKDFVEIMEDGRWICHEDIYKQGDRDRSLAVIDTKKGLAQSDLKAYDVVFIALHGKFGEDGRIQSMLDILNVPYTGSGVFAGSLGMDKYKSSEFVRCLGVNTPKFLYFCNADGVDVIGEQIESELNYPCIVKPTKSGSSIGISIVKEKKDLKKAIDGAFDECEEIVIEEFIKGREVTCGVLGNSFGDKLEALLPIEVISKNEFFDYNAKYLSEDTKEICPAQIPLEFIKQVQEKAILIHKAFGCDGLSRSDFILSNDEFYFLEINTSPGLTEQSLCPKEAKATGMSFPEFLDKQVDLAFEKRRRSCILK